MNRERAYLGTKIFLWFVIVWQTLEFLLTGFGLGHLPLGPRLWALSWQAFYFGIALLFLRRTNFNAALWSRILSGKEMLLATEYDEESWNGFIAAMYKDEPLFWASTFKYSRIASGPRRVILAPDGVIIGKHIQQWSETGCRLDFAHFNTAGQELLLGYSRRKVLHFLYTEDRGRDHRLLRIPVIDGEEEHAAMIPRYFENEADARAYFARWREDAEVRRDYLRRFGYDLRDAARESLS